VINRGAPWDGRDGVAAMAAGFHGDVPDLALACGGLRLMGDHMLYLWTFTGTHAGTENRLSSSGAGEWDLGPDRRILALRGWFDPADRARQTA
jgi:hypothetical protein